MKNIITTTIVASLVFVGGISITFAQNTTSSDADLIAQLQAQLGTLLLQVEALTQQVIDLSSGQIAPATTVVSTSITSQLKIGSTGSEVTALQEVLASDPSVYPEGLVTGYFGPLTEQAVRNFQAKYGIAQVGEVGPITRTKLQAITENAPIGVAMIGNDLENQLFTKTETEEVEKPNQLVGRLDTPTPTPTSDVGTGNTDTAPSTPTLDDTAGTIGNGTVDTTEEDVGPTNSDESLKDELITKMEAEVLEKLGQPYEGFEPSMFLSVFSNLLARDFDGAQAGAGIYEFIDGVLVFQQSNSGFLVMSGYMSLTSAGMLSMVDNILTRVGIVLTDATDVESVLTVLRGIEMLP